MLSTIFYSQFSWSQEACELKNTANPARKAEDFASKMAVIASQVSNENEVKVESAATYLMSISSTVDFNEKDANKFIAMITPICENGGLDKKFRSKACTKLSGIHGKLAQKLKLNGVTNGKSAYNYLKLALTLDPNNTEAAEGYALAVVGISNQSYIVRKLAESKLNIEIGNEAKAAKQNLERLNLTKRPIYSKLVDTM